ncbi:MFS transporter [uncultured Methanoregula sp.]|uniref:MFS transporter n=1 Tax=uncultured Methanoregula sp. TaxID=1005933 RepID=UPI002AAB9C15|nr:MFS transporter [uncultured Methanoregula sp.]
MRTPVTLFFGVFVVMALSNAIVPVLPSYGDASTLHGIIYSAYFLGAFISTLPGGILADRFDRMTLMKSGLALTVICGLLLSTILAPGPVIVLRFIEGLGAGLFVAAAMSCVNSRADHARMSGYFMALLNAGLVLGLVCSGWLSMAFRYPMAGIFVFTALAVIPAAVSFFLRDPGRPGTPFDAGFLFNVVRDYRWLWFSSVVIVGITGVAISLYPKFSGLGSDIVGIWIAGMSVATIMTVLIIARFPFPPVKTIRWASVFMAIGAVVSFYTPLGLVIIGAAAGVVMIAQMVFLADFRKHQGIVMGLFSTTSYLGMALLPALAGLVADAAGFFIAFSAAAAAAVVVAVTIGCCSSCMMKTDD